jgi:hypothetical protein
MDTETPPEGALELLAWLEARGVYFSLPPTGELVAGPKRVLSKSLSETIAVRKGDLIYALTARQNRVAEQVDEPEQAQANHAVEPQPRNFPDDTPATLLAYLREVTSDEFNRMVITEIIDRLNLH